MKRIYQTILEEHFERYQQMSFLSGPRQVGKTTIAKSCAELTNYFKYLDWDRLRDREQIVAGEMAVVADLPLEAVLDTKPIVAFDEIHKYKLWKPFLKGFIDAYKGQLNVVVTGSSKLNVFRKGGDSLMGRYFLYRVHPFSVAELLRAEVPRQVISTPQRIPDDQFAALVEFGGYPEPFIKQEKSFYNRWSNLRQQQIFREDIRELAQIQELAQLEVLALMLQRQVGQLVSYSQLAKKIRVADSTIRRWINVLEVFHHCFLVKPWSKNVTRSLLKEPKIYLWDWSGIVDKGAKIENFVACHLLKAVHCWTDLGFGEFDLHFLRDKDKNEVDFLVTQDQQPWLMVEVKNTANNSLNKNLYRFAAQLKPKHTLQLAYDLGYVDQDCFQFNIPKIVSLRTFLSQLI